MATRYVFDSVVWEHDGPGAWHFISLPPESADEIHQMTADGATAFGSVRVEARIGASQWSTSIFPDSRRGTYVLPVKKSVRAAEKLSDGSMAHVEVTLVG